MIKIPSKKQINEGLLSRAGDMFYAFRFLKLLVTPWEKMKAFDYGIIDKKGKKVRKPELPAEKSAYTIFHRLVFNVKRLINLVPGGVANKLASYATALFLIKENTGMSESQIKKIMAKMEGEDWDQLQLEESKWFQNDIGQLNPGTYMLVRDIASPITGETIGLTKSKVVVEDVTDPYDNFLGCNVYKVKHALTQQQLFITNHDIIR